MKTLLASLLVGLSLFLGGCATFQQGALPSFAQIQVITKEARQVTVQAISGDPTISISCSAVVVAPGKALTAAHCSIITDMVLKRGDKLYPVISFTPDPTGRDLAFLEVNGLECPCAFRVSFPAEIDEPAIVVGYPHGIGQVLTYGLIQGRFKNPFTNEEYLITTAQVAPGNSGGPLFVVRGNYPYLVGVIVVMAGETHLAGATELRDTESIQVEDMQSCEKDCEALGPVTEE